MKAYDVMFKLSAMACAQGQFTTQMTKRNSANLKTGQFDRNRVEARCESVIIRRPWSCTYDD